MNKKKIFMISLLVIFIVVIGIILFAVNNKATKIANSGQNAEKSNDVIQITDNYFIEQTNDIFYNKDDYIDKAIKIEGLVYSYEDYNTGNTYYAVVRNTPGCCGNDGLAGIDIRYDGEYPEDNTWVEVEGIIKTDVVDGEEIPAVQVTSMKENEKGITFVTN